MEANNNNQINQINPSSVVSSNSLFLRPSSQIKLARGPHALHKPVLSLLCLKRRRGWWESSLFCGWCRGFGLSHPVELTRGPHSLHKPVFSLLIRLCWTAVQNVVLGIILPAVFSRILPSLPSTFLNRPACLCHRHICCGSSTMSCGQRF